MTTFSSRTNQDLKRKATRRINNQMKRQPPKSPRTPGALGSAILAPILTGAVLLFPIASQGATAIDGSVFQIDFEVPGYTVSNSYQASTDEDAGMVEEARDHLSDIGNGGTASNWVASIQSLGGSNQMNFAIGADAQFNGRFEAFAGAQPDSTMGTWGFSTNFTSYTSTGKELFQHLHLVSADGNSLGNPVRITDTTISGNIDNVPLTASQSYALRYEADLGTNRPENVRFYVDDVLVSAIQSDLTKAGYNTVGGLQANFANNSSDGLRQFSVDNIRVGQVIAAP